jgi:ketosteroid isomerase-like protein
MATTVNVIEELVAATNARDVERLVACFSPSYVNVTPAHPARGFRGSEQVRRNWTAIFAAVPDITARVIDTSVTGNCVWTEWEMSGTRRDGKPHAMAGVIIFGVADEQIVSARFYLEPVDSSSGDVNAAVRQQVGAP